MAKLDASREQYLNEQVDELAKILESAVNKRTWDLLVSNPLHIIRTADEKIKIENLDYVMPSKEVEERILLGVNPFEGWLLPEDFYKTVTLRTGKKLSQHKIPELLSAFKKLLNGEFIERQNLMDNKKSNKNRRGKRGPNPDAFRIHKSPDSFLIIWLYYIQIGKENEFYDSYFYKTNPNIYKNIKQYICKFEKPEIFEDNWELYVKTINVHDSPLSESNSKRYEEWLNAIKYDQVKDVVAYIRRIMHYQNTIGLNKDPLFEKAIFEVLGYDQKGRLIDFIRNNPEKRQKFLSFLKKQKEIYHSMLSNFDEQVIRINAIKNGLIKYPVDAYLLHSPRSLREYFVDKDKFKRRNPAWELQFGPDEEKGPKLIMSYLESIIYGNPQLFSLCFLNNKKFNKEKTALLKKCGSNEILKYLSNQGYDRYRKINKVK